LLAVTPHPTPPPPGLKPSHGIPRYGNLLAATVARDLEGRTMSCKVSGKGVPLMVRVACFSGGDRSNGVAEICFCPWACFKVFFIFRGVYKRGSRESMRSRCWWAFVC
ncbi:unnamed protein product, partial [Ectocarpus sp. 13 AM-2016]